MNFEFEFYGNELWATDIKEKILPLFKKFERNKKNVKDSEM